MTKSLHFSHFPHSILAEQNLHHGPALPRRDLGLESLRLMQFVSGGCCLRKIQNWQERWCLLRIRKKYKDSWSLRDGGVPFSDIPLGTLSEMLRQKLLLIEIWHPLPTWNTTQGSTQTEGSKAWFHLFHSKSTKCWHLINIAICHAASDNYFTRNELQLISQAKGINKYVYHLVQLQSLILGYSFPLPFSLRQLWACQPWKIIILTA